MGDVLTSPGVTPPFHDHGKCQAGDADDSNIPVGIYLQRGQTEWELTADNYMPRKQAVTMDAYRLSSPDRAVLVRIVTEHWAPLYRAALERLLQFDQPDEFGMSRLVYWAGAKARP